MNRKSILTVFVLILAFVMSSAAQTKISPSARLLLKKQEVAAHESIGKRASAAEAPRVQLVLTVDARGARQTFVQMRQMGATVLSKLGRQTVVSIPTDCVDDLVALEGVTRTGHRLFPHRDPCQRNRRHH